MNVWIEKSGVRCLAVLLACFALTGCQENRLPLHPVLGALMVDDARAEGALVTFLPQDKDRKYLPSYARVEKDGSFHGFTYVKDDGVPAGNYVLAIEWPEVIEGSDEPGPDRLKGRFVRDQTLRFTVKPGNNSLPPIRLESGK